jgi:hypothetical protein
MEAMPMRTDCKNYESRTYPGGETVRKCNLDLAPEAPWRCPEGCPAFERRLADVNWKHGSLVTPPTPDEPPDLEGAAELLDEAEDIINAAGPTVLAELGEAEGRPRWWRLWRRRRGV